MSAYLKNPNLTAAAIVVACSLTAPSAHAALTQLLDLPNGWIHSLSAMSADGSTLLLSGSYNTGGWVWRQSTGFVQLPDANYPRLGGISRDGSLVVGSLPNIGAFRFNTDSHEFAFPPVNSPDTRSLALSHDGTTALLSTSDGVFLWNGESQTKIATFAAAGGSISADGRAAVFVAWSGYAAYVWTQAGGLQTLPTWRFLRNPLISADGSRVVLFDYPLNLRFLNINPEGIASLSAIERIDAVIVTGGSPDCSLIGFASGFPGGNSVWSQQSNFVMIDELLAANGASTRLVGGITTLIGTSDSNRVFAGSIGLPNSDGTVYPNIWILYLDRNCPGELNFNAQVDDEDFVLFSGAYDAYFCPDPELEGPCPADFNQDGFVDDADFAIFAGAYDKFLCD